MEVFLLNIAIEKGLEELKEKLESYGHKVFYIGDNNTADAVLYEEMDRHPYYEVNNVPSVTANAGDNVSYGALLINVRNKSFDQIVRMLDSRLYSPLF